MQSLFRKSLIVLSLFLVLSCQSKKKEPQLITVSTTQKTEERTGFALGKQLFNGKGKCSSCHQIKNNSIGPSILAIAAIYKKEQGNIVKFLKQEADPIVKPETYSVMKTNFALLKTFKEYELKALETYILEIKE